MTKKKKEQKVTESAPGPDSSSPQLGEHPVPVPRKRGPKPKPCPRIDAAAKLKLASEITKRYYTLTDVRRILGISSVTANRWMKEGRFTGVAWAGSRWVFDPDFKIREPKRDGKTVEVMKRLIPDDRE